MNKFADMLMRDSRNPYGSKGGYVRDKHYEEDYARRRDYEDMRKDYEDMRRDYEDMRKDYERIKRDYNSDMRMRDNANYQDYRRNRRDYGEPEYFTEKEIKKWDATMENEDGTRGAHFRPEEVKRACEKAGIDCEEFGEDIFGLAMNMKYSDDCKVAKKYGVDIPEYYADMAKAFLKDKDGSADGEEKLYVYYKTLVEKDK